MNCLFLYNNFLTSINNITAVSSLRNGYVTPAVKAGSGTGTMQTGGNFTGQQDLEYTVEIDSVSSGAEIGQATFKWSDGGGSWDASGVLTNSSFLDLNNGAQVKWTAAAGDDFVLADKWYFKGINLFNPAKLVDGLRDTFYRSATLSSPNTITIDLLTAQTPQALILWDHNITVGATITIYGNDSDSWSAPAYTDTISYAENFILHPLVSPEAYRYWRINITDTGNPDGYIQISELFLGEYFSPENNYESDLDIPQEFIFNSNQSAYGISRYRYFNRRKTFNVLFPYISNSQKNYFLSLVEDVTDKTTGKLKNFYFAPNDTKLIDNCIVAYMVQLLSFSVTEHNFDYYSIRLTFQEVLQSV